MIIKKKTKQISDTQEELQKGSSGVEPEKEEKVNLFDINEIDFSQRSERRRGDRRRGYRRIDDRNLISRAHEESEKIKEAAAKEGYKAGLEQSQNDIKAMREAIAEFFKAKDEVFEYIAPDILEISVDIARKIVKKEIEQNPEIVLETILEVLRTTSKEENKINIRVNPDQVHLVKENVSEMFSSLGLDAKVSVIPDEQVEIGSCIVSTSNGVVDATIDTQLEIMREALKGM